MLVNRNMKNVYWVVRNLQLMLKSLGAIRNHISPNYDTLKCAVTGRQVAEQAIAKYHFKGTLPNDAAIDVLHEELARAKLGLVGAKLNKVETYEMLEKFPKEELARFVQTRRINEVCEALAILAHSDLFKRPPWCAFSSAGDPLDKHTWSLPPDFE